VEEEDELREGNFFARRFEENENDRIAWKGKGRL
jgi:hypothetical protein